VDASEAHDRMAVVIAPAEYQFWLTGRASVAQKLLVLRRAE